MRTVKLMLPDILHDRVLELARKDGVSVNSLVATALAEKVLTLRMAGHAMERRRITGRDYRDTA